MMFATNGLFGRVPSTLGCQINVVQGSYVPTRTILPVSQSLKSPTTMSHETSQRSAARPGVEPVTQVSGELPKVNTAIPLILPLALITKMYEFHVHLPSCCCFVYNSKFLDFKDELRALWTAINPSTRVDLIFHVGRLVDAIDNGTVDSRNEQFRAINLILSDRLPSSPEVVLLFMALLVDNDVPARILPR
jgi:hypothetical protein